ncbi:MAG: PAS domain S-box protein [Nitrospira sp.]|nr:PAS domain S-box protein [Nitrospira sp.]
MDVSRSSSSYTRLPHLIAAIMVVVVLVCSVALYAVNRYLLTRTGEGLAVIAAEIADQLDQTLFERYGNIAVAARVLAPAMHDPAGLTRHLHFLEDAYPQYRWIGVTDASGRLLAATNPSDVGGDRSDEAWFRFARDQKAMHFKSVSETELARGGLTVGFSAPILSEDGTFLGVVTTRVGLDQLEDVFIRPVIPLHSQLTGVNGLIEWQLLDREGALLADSMLRDGGKTNLRTLGLPSAIASVKEQSGYIEEQHARRGVAVVTGYARTRGYADFPGFGWSVLVRIDRADILAPIQGVLWKLGIAGLGILGPVLGLLAWAVRRLRAEWTLAREREEWLSAVLTGIGDGVVAVDRQRRVTFMNPVAIRLTGWPLSEAFGRDIDTVLRVLDETSGEPVRSLAGEWLHEEGAADVDRQLILVARDGTERPIMLGRNGAPVLAADGTVAGAVLVLRDISAVKEREQIKAALQESELRFRSLVQSAPDAIVVADEQGEIRSWNDAASKMFGYEEREVVGRSIQILMPERYREHHQRGYARISTESGAQVRGRLLEVHGLRKDGMEFPLECALATWQAGEHGFVCGILRDVTDRKRVEQRMRAEHAIAKILAEAPSVSKAMPEILKTLCHTLGWDLGILWPVDRRANVLHFGESWSVADATLALFEAMSRSKTFAPGVGLPGRVWAANEPVWITNVQNDPNFPRQIHAREAGLAGAIGFPIISGKTVKGVMEFFSRNVCQADEELLAMMAAIGRQIGLFLDRSQIEQQFHQAQKMDAVGKLAGGIAHDFNNLLTVIMCSTQLVLDRRNCDPFTAARVEEIGVTAQRAASLTHQLLAFSRRQMLEVKVIGMNSLVSNMNTMLSRLIGAHIQLQTVLSSEAGKVRVDIGQFEQVLVNLVVNARDAMETGGTLVIETANVDLDEDYARQHEGVTPGPYVMVAVSDTGHGMTPEVQAHMFEPFFTTKPVGKGTGLGLATIYGIVNQSKGNIWLYSEPGRGTTFKIYLPRVDAPEVQGPALMKASPVSGSETILLVEDEDAVRELAKQILEMDGYTVLAAANGEAALALCAQYQGPIHLLVTDVVMPRMSGRRLADQLVALRPNTKVLYTSGYTENAIVHHGEVDSNTPFLQKPFTPATFRSKVREVLDQDSGASSSA